MMPECGPLLTWLSDPEVRQADVRHAGTTHTSCLIRHTYTDSEGQEEDENQYNSRNV